MVLEAVGKERVTDEQGRSRSQSQFQLQGEVGVLHFRPGKEGTLNKLQEAGGTWDYDMKDASSSMSLIVLWWNELS